MFDDLLLAHSHAIKETVNNGLMEKTDSIGIEMKNLEEFKFKLKDRKGIVNMAELIDMKEFIDQAIRGAGWVCNTIYNYHKDSPNYWGELGDKDPEYKEYRVQINLEPFMQDDSNAKEVIPGVMVPDNYELGDKMLEKFKEAGNSDKGIECDHFRECASYYIKNKATAKKLIKFIDKGYIQPYIKEIMKEHKIKKVNFLEDRMDFEFKKR